MAKPTTTCPGCGDLVAFDPTDGWARLDGSLSHDDGQTHSDSLTPPREAKAIRPDGPLPAQPEPGEHRDFQPEALPGGQTPVPPGHSVAAMLTPTHEIEIEVEADDRTFKTLPSMFDETDWDALERHAESKGFVPFEKGDSKPAKAGEGKAKVERGEFVSWSGGRGKVDLVVTGGVVPGVGDSKPVFGSKDGPAARVVKYAKDGNGWKATSEKIAVKASDLTKIDDLKPPRKAERKGLEALVQIVADRAIPAGLSGGSAQIAYRRGLKGWPGADVTTLDQEDWAIGRVEALVAAANGDVIEGFADTDLLP